MNINLDFNLKNTINIIFLFSLISIGFNVIHTFTLFISLNVPLNYLFTISWQDLIFNNFNFILITNLILQLIAFYNLSYFKQWLSSKLPKVILWFIQFNFFFILLALAFIFFISLQLFYLPILYFIIFLTILIMLCYYTSNQKVLLSKKIFSWIICYTLIVSFMGYTQNKTKYLNNQNTQQYPIHIQTTYPVQAIKQNSNNRTFKTSISLIPIKHYKNFLIGLSSQNNTIMLLPHDKIIAITLPTKKPTFKASRLYQDWKKVLIFFQEKLNSI